MSPYLTPYLSALIIVVGTMLYIGLPLLALAYAALLWRLSKRQPLPRPLLRRSAWMLGLWLAAIAAFLVSATFHPAPRGYPAAWLGVALVGGGAVAGVALLLLHPKPAILARLGSSLTVGGLLLTAFMASAIHVAGAAYEITAHDNPDIGAVRAALARDPNDSAAHMSQGYYFMMHNDPQDAAVEFQRTAQLEPADSPFRGEAGFMLGHMLWKAGQHAQAMTVYRRLATQNDGWGRAAEKYVARHGG